MMGELSIKEAETTTKKCTFQSLKFFKKQSQRTKKNETSKKTDCEIETTNCGCQKGGVGCIGKVGEGD